MYDFVFICADIYADLFRRVMRLEIKDRFCILLMDENGIAPKYVPKSKIVPGQNFPTHVINFMLHGVYGQWKLPISNIFWSRQDADAGVLLAKSIKWIIHNIFTTGLTVVATVSDHSKVMTKAVDYLIKETNQTDCYLVGYNKVYHIYDPCRLLKSVRNHFVKNNLMYEIDGRKKVARWSHILKMFEIDRDRGKPSKVTLKHVHPEFMDRLTTRYCTQVFSETVARDMVNMINTSKY